VTFFHSNRIPYALVGALAVAIWGRSRATADLDFQVHVDNMESFLKTLPSTWVFDKKWDLYNLVLRELQKRMLVSDYCGLNAAAR
jgi:hypothetical protein